MVAHFVTPLRLHGFRPLVTARLAEQARCEGMFEDLASFTLPQGLIFGPGAALHVTFHVTVGCVCSASSSGHLFLTLFSSFQGRYIAPPEVLPAMDFGGILEQRLYHHSYGGESKEEEILYSKPFGLPQGSGGKLVVSCRQGLPVT